MEFEKVYKDVLKYYPSDIDISDGKIVSETDGFDSLNLISSYDEAEKVASLAGEWESLITWIIYQVLHETAIIQFAKKKYVVEIEINKSRFRELLIENLRTEGYEDMYLEFLEYEKVKGDFK